jgi:hypothetical protein
MDTPMRAHLWGKLPIASRNQTLLSGFVPLPASGRGLEAGKSLVLVHPVDLDVDRPLTVRGGTS